MWLAKQEVKAVSEMFAKSYAQEIVEEVTQRVTQENYRDALRSALEGRFGELPEALAQRIEGCTNLKQLKDLIRQVGRMQSIEEVQL